MKTSWDDRRAAWAARIRRMGVERSIFHCGHPAAELGDITKLQARVLLPLLKRQLEGNERTALDFGCGWGRWTAAVADAIHGRCVGVDISPLLLERALLDMQPNVDFRPFEGGAIPMGDGEADLIWCCMVLSAVLDEGQLRAIVAEFDRVLRPGGLMFLVDNTDRVDDRPVRSPFSVSRTIAEYRELFKDIATLDYLGEYHDLGERNCAMAGRKWGWMARV